MMSKTKYNNNNSIQKFLNRPTIHNIPNGKKRENLHKRIGQTKMCSCEKNLKAEKNKTISFTKQMVERERGGGDAEKGKCFN